MQESRPLVSVCCTTYNHSKYVEAAMQSIEDQDYPNLEVIVLDDGSTDGTLNLLEKFQRQSLRNISIISQVNTGRIGENANKVIGRAKGDFLMLMSLDDLMCPKIISRLVPLIASNNNYTLLTSTARSEINEEGKLILYEQNAGRFGEQTGGVNQVLDVEDLKKRLIQEQHGGSFGVSDSMYRRSLLMGVGGFDNDMLGDDIVLRVKILNYLINNNDFKMAVVPYPVIQYRKHSTNIHRDSERQCEVLYGVLKRYFKNPDLKTLNSWLRITIMRAYRRGDIYNFIRLTLFDKKNQNRLENIFRIIPLIIRDSPLFIFGLIRSFWGGK